jgi:hypothetical protein
MVWAFLSGLLASTALSAYLTLIPFAILLLNVLTLHTSAGVSRHFVGFSCAGSALLTFFSPGYSLIFAHFLRFGVTLVLFLAVRFKYPLKSGQFRDSVHTFAIAPLAIVLSIIAFYDRSLRAFLGYIGHWLSILAIACQILVTKKSRRITVFKTHFPFCVSLLFLTVYSSLVTSFRSDGSQMWTLWLTGFTKLVLLIDLTYYVVYAKQRNDDFDLPGGFDL